MLDLIFGNHFVTAVFCKSKKKSNIGIVKFFQFFDCSTFFVCLFCFVFLRMFINNIVPFVIILFANFN